MLDLKALRENWLEWDSGTVVALLDALEEAQKEIERRKTVVDAKNEMLADLRAQLATARALMAEEAARLLQQQVDARNDLGSDRRSTLHKAIDAIRQAAPLPSGLKAVPVEEYEATKALASAVTEYTKPGVFVPIETREQVKAALESTMDARFSDAESFALVTAALAAMEKP